MNKLKPICFGQPITLIGSCFSDEIGRLLQANGFKVSINPGGTLFHPLAIANLLNWALHEQFTPLRTHQRNDIFLSWDLSGTFYAMSEEAFLEKSRLLYQDLRAQLQKSSHLLLTFGTTWGYTLCSNQQLVANCHKAPKTSFWKELTDLQLLQTQWLHLLKQLKQFNPNLQVILTISPVRHLKDGLVENNRSKARLHLLAEYLCEVADCFYFEAFELVTDLLRDYIYFKEDGAHPNQKAIHVVWEHFQQRFMEASTRTILEEWGALQKSKAHHILYPESKEAKELQVVLEKRTADFFRKYPDFQDSTLA
jgi:hypothetical protein